MNARFVTPTHSLKCLLAMSHDVYSKPTYLRSHVVKQVYFEREKEIIFTQRHYDNIILTVPNQVDSVFFWFAQIKRKFLFGNTVCYDNPQIIKF